MLWVRENVWNDASMQIVVRVLGGVLMWLALTGAELNTAGPKPENSVVVGAFASSSPGQTIPLGWKPLTFSKISNHTVYEVVRDGAVSVVKASSRSSASGLTKPISIDLRQYPVVSWRWKVENIVASGDVNAKSGDDYAARVYISFAYEPDKVSFSKRVQYRAGRLLFGDIPIAAINYIWDARTPIGTIVPNAYTGFVRMIVVESGDERVGQWVEERRNLYQDYQDAFGGEPPQVNGVAIMSDTDNTKEAVTAYYGDIVFHRAD